MSEIVKFTPPPGASSSQRIALSSGFNLPNLFDEYAKNCKADAGWANYHTACEFMAFCRKKDITEPEDPRIAQAVYDDSFSPIFMPTHILGMELSASYGLTSSPLIADYFPDDTTPDEIYNFSPSDAAAFLWERQVQRERFKEKLYNEAIPRRGLEQLTPQEVMTMASENTTNQLRALTARLLRADNLGMMPIGQHLVTFDPVNPQLKWNLIQEGIEIVKENMNAPTGSEFACTPERLRDNCQALMQTLQMRQLYAMPTSANGNIATFTGLPQESVTPNPQA